jgi:ketosteroid isomerase-like protein
MGLLYSSCSSSGITEADKKKIDIVADKWIGSLNAEDIKGLRSTYWPNAVHTNIQADGSKEVKKGVDEIMEGQRKLFDSTDVFAQLEFTDPEKDYVEITKPILQEEQL